MKNNTNFAVPINNGVVAQLVEQRTENPCVTGSIPVDTTPRDEELKPKVSTLFVYKGFERFGQIFEILSSKICGYFFHHFFTTKMKKANHDQPPI